MYQEITDSKAKATNILKDKFRQYMAYIVLSFNIILNVISRLYQIGFQNPFTIEYMLDLAVNTATTMLCYACFIPIGSQNEKAINKSYGINLSFWSNISEKIRTGYIELFEMFCSEQIEIERKDKRKIIIGNMTNIPYDVYFEKYANLEKEEIKELFKKGEITKTQKKAILKANHVKVKPISASCVLSGTEYSTINDAGRKQMSYSNSFMLRKPFIIVISNVILNAITSSFKRANITEFIFDMLVAVLLIVIASVVGYDVGVKNIRTRNEAIKNKALFLSKFAEKNNMMM